MKMTWKEIIFGRNSMATFWRVCAWTLASNAFLNYVLQPIRVKGASMEPTYSEGNRSLINKIAYAFHEPKKGDTVVFDVGEEKLIKRIIALPYERVKIENGNIVVNGKVYEDSYSHFRIPGTSREKRLKEGEYFVIGDNREQSIYGIIERKQIKGKVVFGR